MRFCFSEHRRLFISPFCYALASVHCSSGFACILNSRAICGCKGGAQPVHLDPCIHILLCYDAQQQTTISVQKPEHRRSERITVFMLRKKSPKGDLGGILFFPYSASGLPGLFIWKVLALASILKAPNYSVIISNFIKIFFLKIITIYGILFISLNKIICKARVNH